MLAAEACKKQIIRKLGSFGRAGVQGDDEDLSEELLIVTWDIMGHLQ